MPSAALGTAHLRRAQAGPAVPSHQPVAAARSGCLCNTTSSPLEPTHDAACFLIGASMPPMTTGGRSRGSRAPVRTGGRSRENGVLPPPPVQKHEMFFHRASAPADRRVKEISLSSDAISRQRERDATPLYHAGKELTNIHMGIGEFPQQAAVFHYGSISLIPEPCQSAHICTPWRLPKTLILVNNDFRVDRAWGLGFGCAAGLPYHVPLLPVQSVHDTQFAA